jgi:nitric oxide reductase NorQ protein
VELVVTQTKSGLDRAYVEAAVCIVRGLRKSGKCEFAPMIRGSIMIATTLKVHGLSTIQAQAIFLRICVETRVRNRKSELRGRLYDRFLRRTTP